MRLVLDGVRLALAHFDLEVTAELTSRVTGIFGPSGAGKTSLLEVVAGLRTPHAGRITLDDVLFNDVPARRRHIGYVPQENALFPHMSVLGNIRYGAREGSVERVVEVLELGPLLQRGVTALSGGEQKRVALARALVTSPRLLLLDEPLAGLDRPLHARILAFLQRIRDEFRLPMLYVTHDPTELAAMAEETVVLDRGRVVAVGATADVIAR
ncbi:MAG TPA: ATP-binding cassette domain-containing protein [Thermoanaerobaculia bacterium]|jgi:molybdate transport system ATP-binding protein|nr:ATP-binding cassette domain-containing protein [Thermoanaerobaculia bacterium]